MSRRLSWIAALAALAFVADASAQSMFRGDAAHSGVYPQGPRAFHRVKWTFPTGGRVVSSPVLAGGVVYVGSGDGSVYAIEAASGRRVWKHATGGPVAATPAVAAGRVYVGSYDGRLYAFDARDGRLAWRFTTAGERHFEARGLNGVAPRTQTIVDPFDIYQSSPAVADGRVFFGSGDGNVYALDAASGALVWKFSTGDVVHASPAVANGTVFVGSWDSWFYALDAKTGALRWRFHGGEDALVHNQVGFQSSPTVVDGVVYTGCRDAHVYALDAATGAEKWRFYNDASWVNAAPAVVDGKVYFATSDSALYRVLDAKTGKELQQQKSEAWMFSSPAIAGDVVLIGAANGTLDARDRASGERLWQFRTEASKRNPGWILTADGAFNNALLFRSAWVEPTLRAVEHLFDVGSIFSSPLVADGAVYFGSTDGNVYAIE